MARLESAGRSHRRKQAVPGVAGLLGYKRFAHLLSGIGSLWEIAPRTNYNDFVSVEPLETHLEQCFESFGDSLREVMEAHEPTQGTPEPRKADRQPS